MLSERPASPASPRWLDTSQGIAIPWEVNPDTMELTDVAHDRPKSPYRQEVDRIKAANAASVASMKEIAIQTPGAS